MNKTQSASILMEATSKKGELPEWIKIFPRGEVRVAFGQSVYMTGESWRLIQAAFEAHNADMVLDYEHQTNKDVQAPAAAWINELSWREDGLWGRVSEWIPPADDYVRTRKYKYLSPTFHVRPKDRVVVSLLNVALTNQPRMQNVAAVAAKLNPGEEDMNEELLKLLGLAEDAGEDLILAKVQELVQAKADLGGVNEQLVTAKADLDTASQAVPKPVLDVLELKDGATADQVVLSIKAIKSEEGQVGELHKQVLALKDQMASKDAEELTGEALRTGRTSTSEVESWGLEMAKADPEQYRKVVMSKPEGSVVPLGELEMAKSTPSGAGGSFTPEVNKVLCLSDEVIAKHGPKED